jgi:hypothetical protein
MDDANIRRSLIEMSDQFLRKRRTMSRALVESRTTTHSGRYEPTDQPTAVRPTLEEIQAITIVFIYCLA